MLTNTCASHAPAHRNGAMDVAALERLIVALDQDNRDDSRKLVKQLGDSVLFYKVGWVSLLHGGVTLVEDLLRSGKRVFLDLKIFDVPNTVREAITRVANLGVRFATVHGNRENIEAALAGRQAAIDAGARSDLKILAVTVLTSLNENDVRQLYSLPAHISLQEHALNVARRLIESGGDGVIASPWEVERIREEFPDRVLIVAPGIRVAGESSHDHKRSGPPYESIKAGADYIVVGRSIYQNPDPKGQAERYVAEIERGLRSI